MARHPFCKRPQYGRHTIFPQLRALWVMSKYAEIKLYFSGWSFGGLIALLAVMVLYIALSINIPTGEVENLKGKVLRVSSTYGSEYNSPYPSARVKLSSGKEIDLIIPRKAIAVVGEEVTVTKQGLLFGGDIYTYGIVPENP